MQNTSHAVMAQRTEAKDSLDNFPTPPWATRALLEHVIEQGGYTERLTCLEPACGAGHMAKALSEYFGEVGAYDVHDYGFGAVADFLNTDVTPGSWDWVITNPPFRLAEEFIIQGLSIARRGVAVLVRTVFLESIGRYERIFADNPPSIVAQFTERVPMVKGRLDRKASTATGYAWIVWEKGHSRDTLMKWIPPCRKKLEKNIDYIEVLSSSVDNKLQYASEPQERLML
ncbi:SAM-dependent methyltransferase [Roseibium sp.]|uniref:SAM-dependent methyltransferase n=1 Tax=Roseibium sp. TaxID=1936156 RepID=UPI003264FF97